MGKRRMPWDVDRALDQKSLDALARYIMDIRDGTCDEHNPAAGDGPWGLGCRCYDRVVNKLEQDAARRRFPFLRIKKRGLYCQLYVNGTPIRFYRGEPENPPLHHLQAGIAEQQLAFGHPQLFDEEESPPTTEVCWMLAIQTDDRRNYRSVAASYFQTNVNGGAPRYVYTITSGVFPNVQPLARPGVDLGPPVVNQKSTSRRKGLDAS